MVLTKTAQAERIKWTEKKKKKQWKNWPKKYPLKQILNFEKLMLTTFADKKQNR